MGNKIKSLDPNFVIKDELDRWLIDCSDNVRLEEVRFKKEAKLKQIKNSKNYHGYKFEYDIWNLFLSLGPNFISNPNINATYDLKNISAVVKANKDHQNDLVAYFDKHIFIVECKATKSRRGKSYAQLQEAAVDTFTLSQIKNKRIKKLYGTTFVPVHSICSEGYNISEEEKEKSFQDRKVFLITEEIRNYINTVIEVSGSKEFSFNQLLGLFRSGKPDYGKKYIRAFTSKSGINKKHNVFTFSISPNEMIPISTVSHQAASKIYQSKDKMNSHYQRLLTKRRIEQVAEFLNKSHQPFPNNILVNYRGKKKLQFEQNNAKAESSNEVIGNMPGTLIIDACPATFHVIDGQHRLFGYTGVKKKLNGVGIRDTHRVLVTAFENLNVEEEADVFLEVNTNAKPIKPGLVMEIEFSTERVFRRNLATSVVFKLREKDDSALKELILEAEGRGRPLSPKDLQSSLLGCNTLLGTDIFAGYFWNKNGGQDWIDLDATAEKIYKHINTFLLKLKADNRRLWRDSKKVKSGNSNGLLQNIIIGGLFIVIDRITEHSLNQSNRPYPNKITSYCDKNFYSKISEGLKNDDSKERNDKMLQVSYWFGAGKNGQKNVADSYIFKYLKDTGVRYALDFVEVHFDPDKSPEEMEKIRREEKRLAKEIVEDAYNSPKKNYKRHTKGKRYSNAFKKIIKYVFIKNDHLAGDPWSAIVKQDDDLQKQFRGKENLHNKEVKLGGPDIDKEGPWRKLEAPQFYTILSNPKYIEKSIPSGSFEERRERIKKTKAYIWNNLTIFEDHPYPHDISQPKDSSNLWQEGFEYVNLFYEYRGLSAAKKSSDSLSEVHPDDVNNLELRKPEFPIFDDYEKKFRKMSIRIADIYKEEEKLLDEILKT